MDSNVVSMYEERQMYMIVGVRMPGTAGFVERLFLETHFSPLLPVLPVTETPQLINSCLAASCSAAVVKVEILTSNVMLSEPEGANNLSAGPDSVTAQCCQSLLLVVCLTTLSISKHLITAPFTGKRCLSVARPCVHCVCVDVCALNTKIIKKYQKEVFFRMQKK